MSKLLIWSGGLDSTALLLKYLDERICFETVYFNLENNNTKSKMEMARRKKILKYIEKEYRYIVKDTIVDVPAISPGNVMTFTQPHIWINNVMMFLQDYITHISFGYVKYDDFWHIRHNFERFFHHGIKIISACEKKKAPKLEYPLEWYTKEDLVDEIYLKDDKHKEVFDMVWVCECPKKNKECLECLPCKKFKPIKEYFNSKKDKK